MKIYIKHLTYLVASAILLAACSSDSGGGTGLTGLTDRPMTFGPTTDALVDMPTRSVQSLASGFLVSAYSDYGSGSQQTVMHQYEALYSHDEWSQKTAWTTVGSTSDGFYQNQTVKYWDFSIFPYQFCAMAPCPKSADDRLIEGFECTDNRVSVPARYACQTVANGLPVQQGVEPYLIAQVRRNEHGGSGDGVTVDDIDVITSKTLSDGVSFSNAVPLPFHHLTSKVRFAVYTTSETYASKELPISNVKFNATSTSSDGFITSVSGYTASRADGTMLAGQFLSPSREPSTVLLSLDGPGKADEYPDAYLNLHIKKDGKDNAYFFGCKDGMIQIPQEGVKLTVSMMIGESEYDDIPLKLKLHDGSVMDIFTWKPNTLYTYYLVIEDNPLNEITVSATVSEWDDIEGKLSTNIEE